MLPDVAYFGELVAPRIVHHQLYFFLELSLGVSRKFPDWCQMICKRCSSKDLNTFNTEINMHFPGWEGLDMASVWAFPKVRVCLNCGFAEFDVPDRELRMLAEGLGWARSSKSA